jgi:hypothetical protein
LRVSQYWIDRFRQIPRVLSLPLWREDLESSEEVGFLVAPDFQVACALQRFCFCLYVTHSSGLKGSWLGSQGLCVIFTFEFCKYREQLVRACFFFWVGSEIKRGTVVQTQVWGRRKVRSMEQ